MPSPFLPVHRLRHAARFAPLLAVVLLAHGCSRAEPDDGVDTQPALVVLVSLDTTRADRVGAYGSALGLTPHVDALARDGLVFERAYSPAPITLPAHTTLLSGCDPPAHGVHDNGVYRVGRSVTLLSEVLRDAGFATGAHVAAAVLGSHTGIGQGFEAFEEPAPRREDAPYAESERPASAVVDGAVAWLDGPGRDGDAFLFVHLFDAHAPYAPPSPWRERFADPYDAEIALADDQVGRLVREVEARRAGRRVLFVVTADHGEGRGDHGEWAHGVLLHDATMRVPLIVRGDGVVSGRSDTLVGLADVAPTVLAWLDRGVRMPPPSTGRALLATPSDDTPRLIESYLPWHGHGWQPLRGVIDGRHKLVLGAYAEVFDLAADPGENTDLAGDRPELVTRLGAALVDMETALRSGRTAGDASLDDAEVHDRLVALGYLPAQRPRLPPPDAQLPDPRDMLEGLEVRDEALRLLWLGRRQLGFTGLSFAAEAAPVTAREAAEGRRTLERGRQLLLRLVDRHGQDPEALALLGLLEVSRGQPALARRLLEQALVLNPRDAVHHAQLGRLEERLGRVDRAKTCMLRATGLDSSAREPASWLVDHYDASGDWGSAAFVLARLRASGGSAGDDGLVERLSHLRARAEAAGQPVKAPPGWSIEEDDAGDVLGR